MDSHPPRRLVVRGLLTALLAFCFAPSPGCESNQSAESLDSALVAYRQGQYLKAHQDAESALEGARGTTRDEASYVSGMAAAKLGRTTDAERRLTSAAKSMDKSIAGRANAQLGLMRLNSGRASDAVVYFDKASEQLTGDDARKARQNAALARQQMSGRSRTATRSSNPAGATFALQIGAYQDRQRAERAAADFQAEARRRGLMPVRVVAKSGGVRGTMYAVHVGQFTSRRSAEATQPALGVPSIVTAAR